MNAIAAHIVRLDRETTNVRHRVSRILEMYDDACWDDRFQEMDEAFAQFEPADLSVETIIAVLSYTYAVKRACPHRPEFYERVRQHLLTVRAVKETDDLLRGLE